MISKRFKRESLSVIVSLSLKLLPVGKNKSLKPFKIISKI